MTNIWFFFTLQESTASLLLGTSPSKPPSGLTCAAAWSQTIRRAEDSSSPTSCRKTSLSSPTTREKVQKKCHCTALLQITISNAVSSCVLCFETLCLLFHGLSFFLQSGHFTAFRLNPQSRLNSCSLLVWFNGCLCLHVSLRPKHYFLSGRGGFLRAPSGRRTSRSQQDLWWPSGHSKP